MAIDNSQKAVALATKLINWADQSLDALEALEKILDIATDSGINMVNFNIELEANDGVKHADGATINKLAAAIPTLTAAFDQANGAGAGLTVRTLFNQLRRED